MRNGAPPGPAGPPGEGGTLSRPPSAGTAGPHGGMDPTLAAKPPPGPPRQQPLPAKSSFEEDRPPSAGRLGGTVNSQAASQPGSQTNGMRGANPLQNAPTNFPLNTTYTKESSERAMPLAGTGPPQGQPQGPSQPPPPSFKPEDRDRRVPEPDREKWTRPSAESNAGGADSQRRPDPPAKLPTERSFDMSKVLGEATRERPPSASGDRNAPASLTNGISTKVVERTSTVRTSPAAADSHKAGSGTVHRTHTHTQGFAQQRSGDKSLQERCWATCPPPCMQTHTISRTRIQR